MTAFHPPASRTSDPATSAEAEAHHTASGRREYHAQQFLDLVREFPGSTAVELARLSHLPADTQRHEASRRLPELRDRGLVRDGVARICNEAGTRQMTWWPVENVVQLPFVLP